MGGLIVWVSEREGGRCDYMELGDADWEALWANMYYSSMTLLDDISEYSEGCVPNTQNQSCILETELERCRGFLLIIKVPPPLMVSQNTIHESHHRSTVNLTGGPCATLKLALLRTAVGPM